MGVKHPIATICQNALILLVHDGPEPQLAVAAEIEQTRTYASDRHTNRFQILTAIDRWRAPQGKRSDPVWRQFLIWWNKVGKVAGFEGTSHRLLVAQQCGCSDPTQHLDELAPRHSGSAARA